VAQNIELFTHALSGITIAFIQDKKPNYRTVWLNTKTPGNPTHTMSNFV